MVHHERTAGRGWPLPAKVAFFGFLAIAVYVLVAEHRTHLVYLVPFWPVTLILACLLMHVFMHHGARARPVDGGMGTMR